MSNKRRLKELRARLKVLTEEILPQEVRTYGAAIAENQDIRENAFATHKEEEIAVIRSEIISIKREILKISREHYGKDDRTS